MNLKLKKLESKKRINNAVLFLIFILFISIAGCSSSSDSSEEYEDEEKTEAETYTEAEISEAEMILDIAKEEQENEMYSPDVDSTYLYWLDNQLIVLNGSTKCNIFALNVLYKSGFKTPDENALSRDLFDTTKFSDILPVVGVDNASEARKGDIVVWYNHVILFESQVEIGDELYALGWWAGTGHEDNGENINNNVCYGKYKLNGEFVVRRPLKNN